MHPFSPLMKLCATTILSELWFVVLVSIQVFCTPAWQNFPYCSLQMQNDLKWRKPLAVFQELWYVLDFLDKIACLECCDTVAIGKDFLVKNAISSHPEGWYLHLTSLSWSLVSGCPGKRQLRPCSFYRSVIFATWRSSTSCVPAQKKIKNQGAVI